MSTKHLINAYLVTADGGWWNKLSREEQKEYIKENPGSKYAKHVKKDGGDKPAKPVDPNIEAKRQARIQRVSKLLATNKQLAEDIKPGSPVRTAAAADFRKNSKKIAHDMKNIVGKKEYKAAVVAARADLKGEKPDMIYRIGACAGYKLMSDAMLGAGLGVAAALGGPAAPVAIGVGAIASVYFGVKGSRRLIGRGGNFDNYRAKVNDRAARKLNQQAAHVLTASKVDALTDEQVLEKFNQKLAHLMETIEITPENLALFGKFKKAKQS